MEIKISVEVERDEVNQVTHKMVQVDMLNSHQLDYIPSQVQALRVGRDEVNQVTHKIVQVDMLNTQGLQSSVGLHSQPSPSLDRSRWWTKTNMHTCTAEEGKFNSNLM
jgi:uncharacterized coiled-coil DUF342 family protein